MSDITTTKFNKERFPPEYQSGVGINARKILHDNSKELVEVISKFDVVKPGSKVFELGAGPCRNLYYIWTHQKQITLFCNDLFKDASFESMHPDIRQVVNFYELDSEEMAVNHALKDIDLFLVSDHFMHLEYGKADRIIDAIITKWKPSYILLREVKKEFENISHPRLYHNYEKFDKDYDTLLEKTSETNEKAHLAGAYFIRLLKRK